MESLKIIDDKSFEVFFKKDLVIIGIVNNIKDGSRGYVKPERSNTSLRTVKKYY
ncbi:hypothetical protein JOC94_002756 [Bacillus thermophilus]|uniref:Uncharacterized protein n=1 Tax=Siminovitchia thermophila TaxID=1245522 RepID=A0ABS2R7Y4_9BACI|nr:hypothetical protein [Siminovitchia thermophila]